MTEVKLLGNDVITYSSSLNSNRFVPVKFTAIKTGTLKNIRVANDTTAGHIKVAIYTDNAGEPGSLLAYADAESFPASEWTTIAIADVNITKDTVYWLAFCSDVYVKSNSSGGVYRRKTVTYSTFSFPDPAGTGFLSGTDSIAIAGWGEEPSSASWGGTWGG